MTSKDIDIQHQCIINLLRNRRLKEAQIQLHSILESANLWTLTNKLEQLQISYNYMLQYILQGAEDPERKKIYQSIFATTWHLADEAKVYLYDQVGGLSYSATRFRNKQTQNVSLSTLLKSLETICEQISDIPVDIKNRQLLLDCMNQYEQIYKEVFNTIWLNTSWSNEDFENANLFLASRKIPSEVQAMLVGAVMLSLWQCFDPQKMYWLYLAVAHNEKIVKARATVVLLLCLCRFEEHIRLYPRLVSELESLNRQEELDKRLTRTFIQLRKEQDTEQVYRFMRDEILPEMIRSVKINFDDKGEEPDINPEWDNIMEDKELNDKIKKMSDLQFSGADVHYTSFCAMKSHNHFYDEANWFYPFDTYHYQLSKLFSEGYSSGKKFSVVDMLMNSIYFCDSDKYSMFYMMGLDGKSKGLFPQMPKSLEGDIAEMIDENALDKLKKNNQDEQLLTNHFIQDIYRFFKLSRNHQDYENPFNSPIRLFHQSLLKDSLHQPEHLKEVGDYLFKEKHPEEAIYYYEQYLKSNTFNADICQKIGYCYEKQKHYSKAYQYYHQADITKPDHPWTIKHTAICCTHIDKYAEALACYRQLQKHDPENKNLLFNIGACLMELGKYEEALPIYYELYYHYDNIKTWRAIAWCTFLCKDYEHARSFYAKILSSQPTSSDYLNAAHTELACGHLQEAISHYRTSCNMSENTDAFIHALMADKDYLTKQGVEEQLIHFIPDLI